MLDIGCGPGNYTLYMKKRGFDVTGIDISEGMLSLARKKHKGPRYIMMDYEKLKFKKNSFDATTAFFSIIHSKKSKLPLILRKIRAIIEDKGYFFVSTAKGRSEKMRIEPLHRNLQYFTSRYSKKELFGHLKSAGFKPIWSKIKRYVDKENYDENQIFIIARAV